jgi:hypothetical protein
MGGPCVATVCTDDTAQRQCSLGSGSVRCWSRRRKLWFRQFSAEGSIAELRREPGRAQEWRREVETAALLRNAPAKQLVGLVYFALAARPGKPKDLVIHLDVTNDICTDEGLDTVLNILDKECVQETYAKADEARARYERCRGMPGQTMEDYLGEARIAKRLLEREGPGTTISWVSFARKLLRRSSLAALEQRGFWAAAGASWDFEKTKDAMKLMYGDAHRDDTKAHGWRPEAEVLQVC